MTRFCDFAADDIHGRRVSLSQFAGKVALIVNTASWCGFTHQYRGLQALHAAYAASGFTVLGFPCNQFLQEPGSSEEILAMCAGKYGVTFPMFDKIEVNGARAHPLYAWLKESAPGALGSNAVKWNFTKFLIDRRGMPIVRYAPTMAPENIAPTIERLLSRSAVAA